MLKASPETTNVHHALVQNEGRGILVKAANTRLNLLSKHSSESCKGNCKINNVSQTTQSSEYSGESGQLFTITTMNFLLRNSQLHIQNTIKTKNKIQTVFNP